MPFNSETGAEAQKKSAEKRKQNTAERKAFKEYFDELLNESGGTYKGEPATRKKILAVRLLNYLTDTEGDLDAREYVKLMEFLRDTIGEKPSEKVDLSIEDESAREIDEYFTAQDNKTD